MLVFITQVLPPTLISSFHCPLKLSGNYVYRQVGDRKLVVLLTKYLYVSFLLQSAVNPPCALFASLSFQRKHNELTVRYGPNHCINRSLVFRLQSFKSQCPF